MPRDREALFDTLGSAARAVELAAGKTADDLLVDATVLEALCYRFAVIGEATTRVSEETRARYPHLPWQQMRQMRNVVIHEYDGVDPATLIQTVRDDLPTLVAELERILTEDWPTD